MIGVIRCGMPSYGVSSTIFGSIRIILTSSGVARASSETSIELTKLDLPEPVEPATSKCGIFARLNEMYSPSMSLPNVDREMVRLADVLTDPSTRGDHHPHHFPVDVGHLDADCGLAGNR